MRKTVFAALVLLLIAAAGYYFVTSRRAMGPGTGTVATETTPATPSPAPAPVPNDLPDMPLLRSDGTQFTARSLSGKVILVFFLPDCDHCQREARQIASNLNAFKDYALYFVSTAPLPEQEQFSRDYNLSGRPNVSFAQASPEELYKHFGLFPTPTVYIYREGGRLVKVFRDETPVERIIAAL